MQRHYCVQQRTLSVNNSTTHMLQQYFISNMNSSNYDDTAIRHKYEEFGKTPHLSLSLPLSHSWLTGAGHRPSLFQKVPEAKTWTDACDELPGTGSRGLRRFAEPSKSKTSGSWPLPMVAGRLVNVGPRRFHHKKVAGQEAAPHLDSATTHFLSWCI